MCNVKAKGPVANYSTFDITILTLVAVLKPKWLEPWENFLLKCWHRDSASLDLLIWCKCGFSASLAAHSSPYSVKAECLVPCLWWGAPRLWWGAPQISGVPCWLPTMWGPYQLCKMNISPCHLLCTTFWWLWLLIDQILTWCYNNNKLSWSIPATLSNFTSSYIKLSVYTINPYMFCPCDFNLLSPKHKMPLLLFLLGKLVSLQTF